MGASASASHPAPLVCPDWLYVARRLGGGFVVGEGTNVMAFVHVRELAALYAALVADALAGLEARGPPTSSGEAGARAVETWGPRAYYFARGLEVTTARFMEAHLVPALRRHGAPWAQAEGTQAVTLERATELVLERLGGVEGAELWSGHIAEGLAANMRLTCSRAERALGVGFSEGGDAGIDEGIKTFLERGR
jgi:hypothetical protein